MVGLHLIGDGLGDMWDGMRARADHRAASFLHGAATVVFGILALSWPDVTVLVIAIVFAARLIIFGINRVLRAVRPAPRDDDDSRGPSRRWARVVGAALSLAAAGALAWLILYTTTRDEGRPAVASAIVVAPGGGKPSAREVIAWAHGTTGVHETCAPSVLEGTFSTGAFFSVEEVVEEGWVLVATDYVGLGTAGPHPYLIGQGEARSVLDAVRAARQMPELDLAERTVVWGHSQGGHAALWTGAIGPSYAPEVDLIGVAALAPASNLVALVDNLGNVTGGSIFAAYASRPTPPTIRTSGLPTTWRQGRGSRSRRSRVAVCRSPRC